MEGPAVVEHDRARPGPHVLPGVRGRSALDFIEKALADVRAGKTKTWEPFEVPDEGIGCGFTEAVRGVLSHHMVIEGGKIANYHPYPPTPWNAEPARQLRHARAVRGRGDEHADLRGERPRALQGHRHHARGPQLRPCLPCGVHMYLGKGKAQEDAHAHPGRRPRRWPADGRAGADAEPQDLRAVGDRIEQLLDELQATADPRARDRRGAAAAGHRALRRRPGARRRAASERGAASRCGGSSTTSSSASLLLAHGLHPDDVEARGRARRSRRCARSSPATAATSSCSTIDGRPGRCTCACSVAATGARRRP